MGGGRLGAFFFQRWNNYNYNAGRAYNYTPIISYHACGVAEVVPMLRCNHRGGAIAI